MSRPLFVVTRDVDDDLDRAARRSILDIKLPGRIQCAEEETILRRAGYDREHAAHRWIGRAHENSSATASRAGIGNARNDRARFGWHGIAAYRDPADLVGVSGAGIEKT